MDYQEVSDGIWRYRVSWALTHPQCKYIPQHRILFESVPDAGDSFPWRDQQAQNQQEAVQLANGSLTSTVQLNSIAGFHGQVCKRQCTRNANNRETQWISRNDSERFFSHKYSNLLNKKPAIPPIAASESESIVLYEGWSKYHILFDQIWPDK